MDSYLELRFGVSNLCIDGEGKIIHSSGAGVGVHGERCMTGPRMLSIGGVCSARGACVSSDT